MSKSLESRNRLCGNCKHFVAGGKCKLVQGQIKAKDTCDLFEAGQPQTMNTKVDPTHLKSQVNYRAGFMVETVQGEFAAKVLQLYKDTLLRGVGDAEATRATISYYSEPEPPPALPWPGPVTGLDLMANISSVKVPDTGQPNTNFDGLPTNVEPYPTPNVSPYGIGTTSQPYPSFFTPDPNSVGSTSLKYDITNHPYPGDDTNWMATANKVDSQPSMHGEYGFNVAKAIPEWRYPVEQSQMYPLKIPDIVIPPSGASIQEAITNLREEFGWLSDNYVDNARNLLNDSGGELYLIRAAGETITNHMAEGEKYRRKLSADELNSMTRTAIGKKMDINHDPELETDATVLDAEFDKKRKEIQMLVLERDPQINQAIEDGVIEAVSINGGMPRSEDVEPCDHDCTSSQCELCTVPKGVVLGELDDIALTYVITDPNGMYYKGRHLPSAEPGIKFTSIQRLTQ